MLAAERLRYLSPFNQERLEYNCYAGNESQQHGHKGTRYVIDVKKERCGVDNLVLLTLLDKLAKEKNL